MPPRYAAYATIPPVAQVCAGCGIFPRNEFPEKLIIMTCEGF